MDTDLLDRFTEWHMSNLKEFEYVSYLLSQQLSDDASTIVEQLSKVEAYAARTGYWLAEAEYYLSKFEFFYLTEKGERSEKERVVKLESDVADFKKVRDQLEVLQSAIKQKLILGESLLNYMRQFNLKPIIEKSF